MKVKDKISQEEIDIIGRECNLLCQKKITFLLLVIKYFLPLHLQSRHQFGSAQVSCRHTRSNQWHIFQRESLFSIPISKTGYLLM